MEWDRSWKEMLCDRGIRCSRCTNKGHLAAGYTADVYCVSFVTLMIM